MMLKGFLLGALVVISQCAALELPLLYCYKDGDGKVSAFKARKADDGSFQLPKQPLPPTLGPLAQLAGDAMNMMYEDLTPLLSRQLGVQVKFVKEPHRFLSAVDTLPYKSPFNKVQLPEVVLPFPPPEYAVFSKEEKEIIRSLFPMVPTESAVTKPSAVGSELIILPVKEDSNGKVTAFLAEQAEDGKLKLVTRRERLPLSVMSDNDKDVIVKNYLNVVAKRVHDPDVVERFSKLKLEFVRNGQFRIIKKVCNEQFDKVEAPEVVVPYPIPDNVKLSEADMAIIKALHPSPPYLLYAGIGAGVVVVVLIVAFFVFRHFRNKNKQSSPF